jgi:hypothetical protein
MTEVAEVNAAASQEVDVEKGVNLRDPPAATTTDEAGAPCRAAQRPSTPFTPAGAPGRIAPRPSLSPYTPVDPKCCCASGSTWSAWDVEKVTQLGVNLSAFFFAFLQWGQIITNFRNPEEMLGLRWDGYGAGAMGDLILASLFCNLGEYAQARVNILGTISTLVPIIQMFAYSPPWSPGPALVPPLPFFIMIAIALAGMVLIFIRFCGKGEKAFARWMKICAILGGGLVGYMLVYEMQHDMGFDVRYPMWAKGNDLAVFCSGFVVLLVLVWCKMTTDNTGAWLATFLFMYMPLPQIWQNIKRPASAVDFNISWIYFCTLGNGLGLARAIHIDSKLWMTGTIWACLTGGLLMSGSVLSANRKLPEPFLTPLTEHLLMAFNLSFLVYFCCLVTFFTRKNLVVKPQMEAPTGASKEKSSPGSTRWCAVLVWGLRRGVFS